jgi:hypothetical protein
MFVEGFLRLSIRREKFFVDGAFDKHQMRLLVIKKLKAITFITLNPRSSKAILFKRRRRNFARSTNTR